MAQRCVEAPLRGSGKEVTQSKKGTIIFENFQVVNGSGKWHQAKNHVASRRKKKLKQAQEDAKKGMQTSFDDPCRTGKSKRKRRKGLKRKEKEGKGRKRKEKEGKRKEKGRK